MIPQHGLGTYYGKNVQRHHFCVYMYNYVNTYPCPEAIDIYLSIVPSGIAIPESCRGIQRHASILKT